MAGGGTQNTEGTEEVGEADAGLEQGRGGCRYLGPDILDSGAVGTAIRILDVGDDATHQEDVGKISPHFDP